MTPKGERVLKTFKMGEANQTFQERYYKRCEEIGKPLNEGQKWALENVLEETFGYQHEEVQEYLSPPKIFDPRILLHIPYVTGPTLGRLYNVIAAYASEKYRKEIGGKYLEEVIPTDSDALEVYNAARPKKGKAKAFRGLGNSQQELLEKYLKKKGII